MKKYYSYLTIALLILFSVKSNSSFAQRAFYFGPDATVQVADSVVLRLNDYVGEHIQWQKSLDKIDWIDIPGANADTLLFEADTISYFRAKVIAGDCDPFYSDIKFINVYELKENVVLIDPEILVLISDSTEIANGIYRFEGDAEAYNIEVGNVIAGTQDGGFLRKVIEIMSDKSEPTIWELLTQGGTLEDVYDNYYVNDSIIVSFDPNKTNMPGGKPIPLTLFSYDKN